MELSITRRYAIIPFLIDDRPARYYRVILFDAFEHGYILKIKPNVTNLRV